MAAKPLRVSRGLLESSMNRAFGLVINELRRAALKERLKKIESDIPLERLYALATGFAAGQFGHDGAGQLPSVRIDKRRLRAAAEKTAVAWHAILKGDKATCTVAAPTRSRRT